jgi:urease accessory protein
MDTEMPDLATLYIQSCSGGLYRDDTHSIAIAIAPGAHAHVTTQASTIVHSMEPGHADQDIRIEAEAESYLEYLPEPLILFPDSRLESKIVVALGEGATVLIADAFLMHDPSGESRLFSAYASEIAIEDDSAKPLALDRLSIDPGGLDIRRVGILGRFGAQGTLVAAMRTEYAAPVLGALRAIEDCGPGATIGTSLLPSSAGVIARILAVDGVALKWAMHACWSACRTAIKGTAAVPRRK